MILAITLAFAAVVVRPTPIPAIQWIQDLRFIVESHSCSNCACWECRHGELVERERQMVLAQFVVGVTIELPDTRRNEHIRWQWCNDQAKRIHNRLCPQPPSSKTIPTI